MLVVAVSLVATGAEDHIARETHLAVIDVTDGSNVDVRLGALKGSGVAPGGVDELCLAPGTESRLDGVGGLLAQSARGAEESPSERHDAEQTNTGERMRDGGERWDGGDELLLRRLEMEDGPLGNSAAMIGAGHVRGSASIE